ncbi:MAG: TolC family protein [Acidobacteria bacterium]|nr:MAG: TolC family protein [Acidobacteriota bacterium]
MRIRILGLSAAVLVLAAGAQAPPARQLTLPQALRMARANSATFEAAVATEAIAKAGTTVARAGLLPSANFLGSYLYTQGNRYIANNAVHEYLSQGDVHEALSFGSLATVSKAQAAEAFAAAQAQIAGRGLDATVTADYYMLVAAGHGLTTAQLALADAQKYLHISQELENGGEVAHSDVIKADLQVEQRQRDLRQAQLAQQQARLQLAVLLFPNFEENFTLVDDLATTPALPALARIQALARNHNPILAAAQATLQEARQDVVIARAGLLPALTLDYTYGIDAAQFAVRNELGLPNLGSSATASLSIPIFDWGARHAQLRQSHLLQQEAAAQLGFTRRQLEGQLLSFYAEAQAAEGELATLARSRQLAAESLRLSALRYKDGEATIVELVDAETANTAARDAYDTGLVRYHVALAQLKTLTGPF